MHNTLSKLTNYFPLWIVIGVLLALLHPPIFTWFSGTLITIGLGIIMLGMGVTLTVEDFKRVMDQSPITVEAVGKIVQEKLVAHRAADSRTNRPFFSLFRKKQ